MSFGTFSFTSPLDPPTKVEKVNSASKWESSTPNSRGFPIGIDGLSPQSDAVVTHKEKRRPFPGSPIGEAPQHMLGLFLSPSEKSQAFLESLTLSPNSTRESASFMNLTDQEEEDFHAFSLPPSAFSEHDEFLMGMGGMDDIDDFDSPASNSNPHFSVQNKKSINPIGRHQTTTNTNGNQGTTFTPPTYSNVTRSRNRSLNGSPYGGMMNSYSPSIAGQSGIASNGFQNSPGGLSSSFGIAPSHLALHNSPSLQPRSSQGTFLFSPSLDSFGQSPTIHDQGNILLPAKRSNSLNPSSSGSQRELPSGPLPSLEDLSSATVSPTQSPSGEHPYGEHPSRTLFVRNINSNVEDQELRALFETYGPIRNMYTQCKHRGFVMISYYDIRHAKCAMKYLQSKLLRRRKLDIHYSIPKDNPTEKDQNQGTLVVFNLDPSISSDELREIFGVHGEIKEIRETPNKKHHKFIEFYDVRDAEKAMKFLNKTEIKSKKIKIEPSRPGGRKSFGNNTPNGGSAPSSHLDPPGSPDFSAHHHHDPANFPHRSREYSDPQSQSVEEWRQGASGVVAPAWRQSEWNSANWDESRQLSQSVPKDFSNWPPSKSNQQVSAAGASSGVHSAHHQLVATRSNSHGMHFPSPSHSNMFPSSSGLNLPPVTSRTQSDYTADQYSSPQGSPFAFHSGGIPLSSLNEYESLSQGGISSASNPHHNLAGGDFEHDLQQQEDRFGWGKSPHGNHRALRSISLPIGHPDMSGIAQSMRDLTLDEGAILSSHGHSRMEHSFSESQNSAGGLGLGLSGLSLLPSHGGVGPDSPGRSGAPLHPLAQSPRGSASSSNTIATNPNQSFHSHLMSDDQNLTSMKPLSSNAASQMGGFSSPASAAASSSSSVDVSASSSSSGGGGGGKKTHSSRKGHDGHERNPYSLDLDAVQNGLERRTTLMIKNIPNKYTQKMLLNTVDDTHQGLYDFFYLPIDFKNKCNVGYAFVNFIEPRSIIGFFKKLHHSKWEKFNSEKVCEITFARIQGKDNLISHFQNSSLMSEDKRCRPMIFHSSGPNVGQPAPFPVGSNIRTRPKEEKNRRDPRARFYKEEYRSTQKKSGSQARSRSLSYNN